jgi:type III pantothenate kinase
MHLVIDVGNTESVIGILPPDSLDIVAHWRYATPVPRSPDELLFLLRGFLRDAGRELTEMTRVVVGSVVPSHSELLRRCLSGRAGGAVFFLEGADRLPIRLDVEEPRTVGADRIANTLAAHHLYHEDTVVVDLGTATTFDCIAAEGAFIGGVIAPGIQAGQEWLGGKTAKLPSVEFSPPDQVIGRRTESCLRSGLFYSAVDAIDGLVGRIVEEWGKPAARVVATGGHAGLIEPYSRTIRHHDPHLTLIGLALAGRYLGGAD